MEVRRKVQWIFAYFVTRLINPELLHEKSIEESSENGQNHWSCETFRHSEVAFFRWAAARLAHEDVVAAAVFLEGRKVSEDSGNTLGTFEKDVPESLLETSELKKKLVKFTEQ